MNAELMAKVTQRLASFGYVVTANDTFSLGLTAEKVDAMICHACNIESVPDCMSAEMVDAICGEFLTGKKAVGQLTGIEMEQIVKSITEGDSKVEFATGSTGASEAFDILMNRLSTIDINAIISHRKLKW